MATPTAFVFIRWTKSTPIRARLVKGGPKVDFQEGTVKEMDATMAEKFCTRMKGFVTVSPYDLSPKELEALKAEHEGSNAAPVVDEEKTEDVADLKKMNKTELVKVATDLGIDEQVANDATKKDLVVLIEEAASAKLHENDGDVVDEEKTEDVQA